MSTTLAEAAAIFNQARAVLTQCEKNVAVAEANLNAALAARHDANRFVWDAQQKVLAAAETVS